MISVFCRKRTVRYLLVGFLTFLAEYSTFLFLNQSFHIDYRLTNIGSMIVAVVVNFSLNKLFVFNESAVVSNGKTLVQFTKYIVLFLCNMLLSTVAIWLLVRVGIRAYQAKLLSTCLIVAWTYIIYKKAIFNHSTEVTADYEGKDE